jgi:hypothetical protein
MRMARSDPQTTIARKRTSQVRQGFRDKPTGSAVRPRSERLNARSSQPYPLGTARCQCKRMAVPASLPGEQPKAVVSVHKRESLCWTRKTGVGSFIRQNHQIWIFSHGLRRAINTAEPILSALRHFRMPIIQWTRSHNIAKLGGVVIFRRGREIADGCLPLSECQKT